MSFNAIGGKNYKKGKSKRGKKRNPEGEVDEQTGIDFYGTVTRMLGGPRIRVKLNDGTETDCIIPGKLRRVWVKPGSYVHVRREDDACELVRRIDDRHEQSKAGKLVQKDGDDDIFETDVVEEHDDSNVYNTLSKIAGEAKSEDKKIQNRLSQKKKELNMQNTKRCPRVLKTEASSEDSSSEDESDNAVSSDDEKGVSK